MNARIVGCAFGYLIVVVIGARFCTPQQLFRPWTQVPLEPLGLAVFSTRWGAPHKS